MAWSRTLNSQDDSPKERLSKRLPWQQRQWQLFDNARGKNRFPHAILLTGRGGMGKSVFAHQVANRLLCVCCDVQDLACMKCSACHLFEAQAHPDFKCLTPEQPGKSIKVAQIRQLITWVGQTNFDTNPKVVIFRLVENLNAAAANALLKLLEEPPGACVFLLISENQTALPATVTSRCQRWHFPPLSEAQMKRWGIECRANQYGAPFGDDLTLSLPQIISELDALIKKEHCPVALAERWGQHEMKQLMQSLYFVLAAIIREKFELCLPTSLNNKAINEIAKLLSCSRAYKIMDEIHAVLNNLYHTNNMNQQLLLEQITIGFIDE